MTLLIQIISLFELNEWYYKLPLISAVRVRVRVVAVVLGMVRIVLRLLRLGLVHVGIVAIIWVVVIALIHIVVGIYVVREIL